MRAQRSVPPRASPTSASRRTRRDAEEDARLVAAGQGQERHRGQHPDDGLHHGDVRRRDGERAELAELHGQEERRAADGDQEQHRAREALPAAERRPAALASPVDEGAGERRHHDGHGGGQRRVRDEERPRPAGVLPERLEPAPPRERADRETARAKPRRVQGEAAEQEHQPLHAPRDHQVVSPEGHRGRQRQEGQRDRAVEQGHARAATRAPGRHARRHEVRPREGEGQEGQATPRGVVQDASRGGEVEGRRPEDDQRPAEPDGASGPLAPRAAEGPGREGEEEHGRPSEGDGEPARLIPAVEPAPVEDLGPREREQREPRPSPPGREQQHAEIEDGEVREERRGGVGVGVEDDRRQEPAQGREDREGAGVQPERRREAHGRRERHRHEGRRRPHERVERVGGIEGEVDDPDPDRHEALGRQAVGRAAGESDAAGRHRDARHESRQDATLRSDPVLLEGVLEEEARRRGKRGSPRRARARSRRADPPTDPRRRRAPAPARSAERAAPRPPAHRPSRGPPPRLPEPRPPGASWPGRLRGRAASPARRVRKATTGAARPAVDRARSPSERRRLRRPRALLQVAQASLEPAHPAPQAQEHQDEDEDDDRGREEEKPQRDQRDDRQPSHVVSWLPS